MSLYNVGDQCFVRHDSHSWVLGKLTAVVSAKDAKLALGRKTKSPFFYDAQCNDTTRGVDKDELKQLDEDDVQICNDQMKDEQVDDLLKLTQLHDSTLLRCLFLRYMRDVVYTNIGAIVVALNPFNFKIPHYMDDQVDKYLKEFGGYISEKVLPHSWAQAHNTYYDLCSSDMNQCILISGESGAGKTEATKIVMRYLSRVSALKSPPEIQEQAATVLKNLVACSPVLEAFGNARTVRNDNSSRFGKLMKVKFDDSSLAVRGAYTTKYLLEKSRICTASPNERVYHAFYLTGIGKDAKTKYMYSKELTKYTSLYAGKMLDNSEFGKAADYDDVCNCMTTLGISADDMEGIWRLTAGCVHSSCITFEKDGEGSKLPAGDAGEGPLDSACALWGIPDKKEEIKKEFLSTTLMIMGKATVKVLAVAKAVDARDAFSKAIYDTLFTQLVEKCNLKCDVPGEGRWIALLDIFGFEDFEINSFEQMCINLANETLQNHYNDYIFKRDMEECRKEGISVVNIACPDNGPCLKLISDGILTALDDECSMGSGTDQGFFDKVVGQFDGKSPFFSKKKTARENFIVHHYAGDVSYNVKNWLEKNRDTIKEPLKEAMRASRLAFCATLFPDVQAAKPITVGSFFRNQLKDLMDVINSTNPHWIRCIKPHPAKKARMFNGQYTMNQLASSGVLGTVKIRKAGYPVRWKHLRFALRYQPIAAIDVLIMEDATALAQHCRLILQRAEFLEEKYAQIGKTIVFMKAEVYPLLERKRLQALATTTRLLQKTGRGMLRRIRLYHTKYAMRIQKAGRGYFGRLKIFDAYEEKHAARIKEERRVREERRKAEEEERKKLLAAMRDIIIAEAGGRKQLTDGVSTFWQQFWAAEREESRETAAFVMKREEEERRRVEEERKRKQYEAFLESIKGLIGPLFKDEEEKRQEMEKREPEYYKTILYEERKRRIALTFELAVRKLSRQETQARAEIHADLFDENVEIDDAFAEIKKLRQVYETATQLNAALERSREARREREEARKERVENKQRSRIELLLYHGQDGVFPKDVKKGGGGPSSSSPAADHHNNDPSSSSSPQHQQSAGYASPFPSSSLSPMRIAPRDAPLETDRDELMKKLKVISEMDRAAPVHARAAALAMAAAPMKEQDAGEVMGKIREKLDPLKKRPLRNVEVGQRVYSHRDYCHGEVLAKRPGGGVGIAALSAAFQVKLDSGVLVWLELDDVSEATGSHALSTSERIMQHQANQNKNPHQQVSQARSVDSSARRQQQQATQRSGGYHRDPVSGSSSSVQRLMESERLAHPTIPQQSKSRSRGTSPAPSSQQQQQQQQYRRVDVAPPPKTSGTTESKPYFSNWQARMAALENDDF